jgi:hypothetical protein
VVTDNPARFVYGTIVTGALLAAEGAHPVDYQTTVASVAVALTVYWLAHTYADLVAERLLTATRLTLKGAGRSALSELPILTGAAVPLGVVVILWIVGASLTTAISWATYSCAGMMVLVEIIAGLGSGLRGWALVGQMAFGVVLGLFVVALKILLH